MAELSIDERRFLFAAFNASPQHWFRPKVVGRNSAFPDRRTAEVLSTLVRAGLLEVNPDHTVRLTVCGRATISGLLQSEAKSVRVWRRGWVSVAIVSAAMLILFSLLWLLRGVISTRLAGP
jgi:hypothetical protein